MEAIRPRQDYAKQWALTELRAEMEALETPLTNGIYAVTAGLAGLVTAFGLFT